MSWVKMDGQADRWCMAGLDGERTNLLVRVGDEFRELHDTTVHVYVMSEDWRPEYDANPLDYARHRDTYNPGPWGSREYGAITAMDDDEAFAWLELGGYLE